MIRPVPTSTDTAAPATLYDAVFGTKVFMADWAFFSMLRSREV